MLYYGRTDVLKVLMLIKQLDLKNILFATTGIF